MKINIFLILFTVLFLTVSGSLDYPTNYIDDLDALRLGIRDSEYFTEPQIFGHKHITGGAGEGDQFLGEKNIFKHREQVKSDNVLPAYCEPPNPCPVGYTSDQGCIENFENSAEASRNYQAQQECLCDQEHMFNCPVPGSGDDKVDEESVLNELQMSMGEMDKKIVAKKSPPPFISEGLMRKKRTFLSEESYHNKHAKINPYLQGEPLRSVSKKDGKHRW
uniref:Neuroendocrine protein 7B2 n=1 Tax=Strongyloides papillosus TaxID=174720 RepID=A0A0N5BZ26_STREA